MDAREAAVLLEQAELVACLEGPLGDAKELFELCLAHDIPAVLGKEACEAPSCTPKVQVRVRPEDVTRVGTLHRQRWLAVLANEGLVPVAAIPATGAEGPANDSEGDPPCPACGTVAPYVAGACSDCGLQLE